MPRKPKEEAKKKEKSTTTLIQSRNEEQKKKGQKANSVLKKPGKKVSNGKEDAKRSKSLAQKKDKESDKEKEKKISLEKKDFNKNRKSMVNYNRRNKIETVARSSGVREMSNSLEIPSNPGYDPDYYLGDFDYTAIGNYVGVASIRKSSYKNEP